MKVAIACGGSGGHLVPGLALAASLRERRKGCEFHFVAGRKPIDRKMLKEEKKVLFLPIVGMPPLFSLHLPLFLLRVVVSSVVALFWALRVRPDLFVGFGGYVEGPVILTALLLKKPFFLHEENVVPGRANLWLSRLGSWTKARFRIGIAFEETRSLFGALAPVVYAGNPLRRDLARFPFPEARNHFGLKEEGFTLLVSGGSQGSHGINRAVLEAFQKMRQEDRRGFQVIHLAGEKDAPWVEETYHTLNIPARVYPFLEKMGEAYSAADLVIARGGAMTLSEIGYFQKPALLIPLSLARNHQSRNVGYLASRGGCVFLDEDHAMTEALPQEMVSLKNEPSRRKWLSEGIASFYPDGVSSRLADEVLRFIEKDLHG